MAEAVSHRFGGRSSVSAYDLDFLVNYLVEQSLAADAEELAADAFAFGDEFPEGDRLFLGGYEQVFRDRFSQFDIRTGQRVAKVRQVGAEVVLETQNETHVTDRVVITIPLGVLKTRDVQFDPPLPDDQRAAIGQLGMGCLNKLYLRFDHVFWPEDVEGFLYRSPVPGQWSLWLNQAFYTGQPILLAFNAGGFGREIERRLDADVVDEAMAVVRMMMGSQAPDPIAHQITRWNSDPFSRGSYSFIAPGVTTGTIQTLARPVNNRLFFAGEATATDFPSTVHGAYLSGRRVAEQISQDQISRW